ncbi:ANTAR domain-containing protein [Nonomuraea endophytica]|uniref:ANTAR domain-containing protein n=1 Tax=Nonomuraea endophytica TaxID=714136 RepID=UPI0037C77C86
MNTQRSAAVWAAITDDARALGGRVTIETVCHSCAGHLHAQAAVALTGPPMGYEPQCASHPAAFQLMDIQATLGEGPGLAALADQRPVLVPELAGQDAMRRWPVLAPAAAQAGVCAVFAFPLLLGAISVGVLEISRVGPGWLEAEQVADALIYADAALMVHLHQTAGGNGAAGGDGVVAGDGADATVERWAQVHHATGIVAVQAGVDLRSAFVRLRAHAYATERSLMEVAGEVVARRLRFSKEPE